MFTWMVFVLLAAPSHSLSDSFDRITANEAARRVARCGLGPARTRFDELLQEEFIVAQQAKSATDKQLACADKAASWYGLRLRASIQPRYEALRGARTSRLALADSRAWLASRGLLGKIPKYREGVTDDAVFSRQLEALCGPKATGAFQSELGFHTYSPAWEKRELRPPDLGRDVIPCLLNVTTAAGFRTGFIGNEAPASAK